MTVPRRAMAAAGVTLDPVRHAHDDALRVAVRQSQAELSPWMPWAGRDEQREFTEFALRAWRRGTEFHFTILVDGTPSGVIGLRRAAGNEFEIGYWISTAQAGKGHTTEAAQTLLDFAFETLGAEAVILNAGADNVPSRRVAAKLGFQLTGPLAGGMEGRPGTFFPALSHRLDREGWAARRAARITAATTTG